MNAPRGRRQEAAGSSCRRVHRSREQDRDVQLSKALSYALRHGALKLGLPMGAVASQEEGEPAHLPYVQAKGRELSLYLAEESPWRALFWAGLHKVPFCQVAQQTLFPKDGHWLPQFQSFTTEDVQRVVETNRKQRFALKPGEPSTGPLIRANQGHSLQVPELELIPLETPQALPPVLAHGTFWKHWPFILIKGLSCQGRTHIHLAPGLPGDRGVISGMRPNCEVVVFIDGPLALADGIPFFRSANGVILTPGNTDGLLLPKYFKEALQLRPTRKPLSLTGDKETEGPSGPKHSSRAGRRKIQQ